MSFTTLARFIDLQHFRTNACFTATFDRIVTAPEGIKLSNGLHLPHGTLLTIPSSQVSADEETWENPDEYDAFRFEKLRQAPGAVYNYQYTTTTEKSLHFGIGRHVCPGVSLPFRLIGSENALLI